MFKIKLRCLLLLRGWPLAVLEDYSILMAIECAVPGLAIVFRGIGQVIV